jgi:hypothetical protein
MIQLAKGETQFIYVTLTEKQLLPTPNYLFRFINRQTKLDVKFILLYALDVSLFKERYNKFSIKTDKYFTLQNYGQYDYEVYETTSTSNTNEAGLNMLESGIMMLNVSKTIFKEYQTTDIYKIRK